MAEGDAPPLLDDNALVARIFAHIDAGTTDCVAAVWREPVANYLDPARFAAERALLRSRPIAFCPAAALPEPGSFLAREAAGIPLIAVRGQDGAVRVFRNACRHRGAALAAGAGCAKALVCPYHAWTYALDGALAGIPDSYGFPGLDRGAHGLVPVGAVERHGLVFVNQAGPAAPDAALDPFAGAIPAAARLVGSSESELAANWKLVTEGFLEGYHIRATHAETFYPVQYHNLNVIEAFGPHNRVTFPYRKLERQRAAPPASWTGAGALSQVWHLFPSTLVDTFPQTVSVVAIEPLDPARTRLSTWLLTDRAPDAADAHLVAVSNAFVQRGFAEDVAMVSANQRGLASGANHELVFGLYEGALGRFHAELARALGHAGKTGRE